MTTINIAKDFSEIPGARHKSDGPYSGELFREEHLEPLFKDQNNKEKINIILDGTEGYGTSFLEEAFGGLARKYGKEIVKGRLQLISQDSVLIDEIIEYINEAK